MTFCKLKYGGAPRLPSRLSENVTPSYAATTNDDI